MKISLDQKVRIRNHQHQDVHIGQIAIIKKIYDNGFVEVDTYCTSCRTTHSKEFNVNHKKQYPFEQLTKLQTLMEDV